MDNKGRSSAKHLVKAIEEERTSARRPCTGTLKQPSIAKIQGCFDALDTQSGWEVLVKVKEEGKRDRRLAKKSLYRLGAGERQNIALS